MSSLVKFDIIKYGVQAGIGFGSMLLYDVYVEGLSLEGFGMSDGYSFVIASLASAVLYDFLSSYLPFLDNGGLSSMFFRPLLNAFVYMYVYNMITAPTYIGVRDNMKNLVIGALLSLFISFVESPIASLFGLRIM